MTRRNYIVTGGTQGVGEAIVKRLSRDLAANIIVIGRDKDKGREAEQRLSSDKCGVSFVACDLADAEATQRIFQHAVNEIGHVDGLVNAAALTNRGGLADGSLADWDLLFAVNARAPFILMQGQIQHALARKAPASIVNILSMNAFCGRPNLAIYSATKSALLGLTRNAANAHVADRIRVNGIAMGWAATPAEIKTQQTVEHHDQDWMDAAAAGLPLGRLLTVEEVAESAAFLLGDASGLMTGNIFELEQWVRGAPPPR